MNNTWSHLPNAHNIDWVLKSVKENPGLWSAARDVAWGAGRDADLATGLAARIATWSAALYAARSAARLATRLEAWDTGRDAARGAARLEAWDTAQDAIAALVAYDDCDQFLSMSYEKLRVWAILSEDPRAILLLPMIYVKGHLVEQGLQPT